MFAAAGPAAADGMPTAPEGGAGAKPTVVMVHGAFADALSWASVVERLQSDGFPVVSASNPLRGLANDSAYIASLLETIKGPIVMVGHSYGGAVISHAAAGNSRVKSLVYISALMPEKGEILGRIAEKFVGGRLNDALRNMPFQDADGRGTDLYVDPEKFAGVLAGDLPAAAAAAMAAAQRPIVASAFSERATKAAWKKIPSWALVAKNDKALAPDYERFAAKRARSHTVEIPSSHMAMLSHPDAVAQLIRDAAAGRASDGKASLAATGTDTRVLTGLGVAAAVTVLAGAGLVAIARKRRDATH
ncbi:alpha/beta fold hydrolase [Streptomyces sp. GC420]|nr:alpha/beta fold hydrolase [Streptomyces sp. GC420]